MKLLWKLAYQFAEGEPYPTVGLIVRDFLDFVDKQVKLGTGIPPIK